MAAANIGIMDGAYFVGRGEILSWINATLQLSLGKVEEVGPPTPLSYPHFSTAPVFVLILW